MATVTISPSNTNPVLKVGYSTSHTGWSGDTALYKVTLWVEPIESLSGYNSPYFGYWIELKVSGRSAVRYKDNSPNTWTESITNSDGYWSAVPKNTACHFDTNCPNWSKDFSISYTDVTTYTVSYNANGGTGAPNSQTKYRLKNLTLALTTPSRTNYRFTGWNTKADGSGTPYSAGGTYDKDANLTLYARWELTGPSVYLDANNYLVTDEYGTHLMYPSETKFLNSSAQLNAYRSGPNTYTPDTGNAIQSEVSLRGSPYYNPEEITLVGYFTGDSFGVSNNKKIYEVIMDEATPPMPKVTRPGFRNHLLKGVADSDESYFSANTITYPLSISNSGSYAYIDGYEYNNDDTLYLPIVKNETATLSLELPQWKLASGNITFYALWSKPDLTFTFDADNADVTANSQNQTVSINVGTPGFDNTSYHLPNATEIASYNWTPRLGAYIKKWATYVPNPSNPDEFITYLLPLNHEIVFGKYLLNTIFTAIWYPFHHSAQINFNYTGSTNSPLNSEGLTGAETYTHFNIESLIEDNKPTEDATFYGLYTSPRGGRKIIDADGYPVGDNVYFNSDKKWIYRGEDNSTVTLYAHWIPDTNAFINMSSDVQNPDWQYGYIYINTTPSGQEPTWEQVPEAIFLENQS